MKTIIINRVSDRKQKDGYSLDAQQKHGRKYAKEHGFTIIKEFTFQETASKQHQRKVFQDIISFIKQHPERLALIAEKSDRIGRNMADKETIQNLYLSGKLVVHLYKERKVYDESTPPSERLFDDVMSAMAKFQANCIGMEALKGMKEKAEQGWIPAKAPLGYVNAQRPDSTGGRRNNIILPDPETSPLVFRIFELRAEQHMSYEGIRLQCLREELVPEGRLTSQATVASVLSNPFYGGRFQWRGDWYDGAHELIVDPIHFRKVQNLFEQSGVSYEKRRGILSRWLRCSCGCLMTYDPKVKTIKGTGEKRVYDYYRCANGKKAHAKLQYISEANILKQMEKAVEEMTISDAMATKLANALSASHKKAREARRQQVMSYKVELEALAEKQQRAFDLLSCETITADEYRTQVDRIEAERQHKTDLMQQANETIDDVHESTAQQILELATQAKSLWVTWSPQEQRQFLERILSNQVVDGLTVRYEMKKPFRTLSEMASSSRWRAWQDSNLRPSP